jgi:hypothetical protein
MKTIVWLLLLPITSAAQAHPSLVPHHHPHGVSLLPDSATFIVGGIFVLALALVAYTNFRRAP